MNDCKSWLAAALAALIAFGVCTPAEAHIVYFKDGTAIRGAVTVKDGSLIVKGGGVDLSFTLDSVRSVSFSDEPIAYEQHRLEDSRLFNNDLLLWSVVGVNVLVIGIAMLAVAHPGAAPLP